jgi:hypothetical protein
MGGTRENPIQAAARFPDDNGAREHSRGVQAMGIRRRIAESLIAKGADEGGFYL